MLEFVDLHDAHADVVVVVITVNHAVAATVDAANGKNIDILYEILVFS